eukprot:NODE_142_length_15935_cov_1.439126.p12 type:complete len:160 gc:universal NODE_142_length_15935_cov_1.439126:6296-5817(-)
MPDLSDDLLLEQLEAEEMPNHLYEKRVVELQKQFDENNRMREMGCGDYNPVKTDEEILRLTTTLKKVVLHFRHSDFKKCLEMDGYLKSMAKKYRNIRFGYCDVLQCPFIVEKFKIKVLPHLVVFEDGVAKKHFIGFEEFGIHKVEEKHVAFEIMNVFNK